MELKECVSSNIKAYGKDGDDLIVEYLGGRQYRYKGAAKLYEELEAADSKGRFIASVIKTKFECERI